MNISKMKKAAEKLIAAEGRKETLAALSDFAQVCGPEKILALIDRLEKLTAEHGRAVKTLQKAGYTDHGGELWKPPLGPSPDPLLKRIDALTAERDALTAKLAELEKQKPRAYEIEWSNGHIELSFDQEGYDVDYVELYGPPTIIQLYARQIIATTQPVATPITQTAPCQECNGFEHLACVCQEKSA